MSLSRAAAAVSELPATSETLKRNWHLPDLVNESWGTTRAHVPAFLNTNEKFRSPHAPLGWTYSLNLFASGK